MKVIAQLENYQSGFYPLENIFQNHCYDFNTFYESQSLLKFKPN